MPSGMSAGLSTTAAATTGPAKGPRPDSSTPAIGPPPNSSSMASSSKVAFMARITPPSGGASRDRWLLSKELELAAGCDRRLEEIGAQLGGPRVETQSLHGQ